MTVMKGIHYRLHTNEWGIPLGEQGCGLRMKASTARNVSYLGNRRIGCGSSTSEGEWSNRLSRMQAVTSSGTSEGRYIALSEVVEEVLVLRQEVRVFVELSMRMLRRRRTEPSTLI